MFPIFDAQDSDETLSHDIVNYLEFLFTSCFGRIYAKSTTQLKISGSETGDKSHKIPKAFSKMNTGIVEALLIKISNTIFEQIEKMLGWLQNYDPIDWSTFIRGLKDFQLSNILQKYNKRDFSGSNDTINEAEPVYSQVTKWRYEREFNKVYKMYDLKVASKLLRMIEMMTCVALSKDEIQEWILNILNPDRMAILLQIFSRSHYKHSVAVIKIFDNLIRIGLKDDTLTKTVSILSSKHIGIEKMLNRQRKLTSKASPSLDLFLSIILSYKQSKWSISDFQGIGSHSITVSVLELIKSMAQSKSESLWNEELQSISDHYFEHRQEYSSAEAEVCMSLLGSEIPMFQYGALVKNENKNVVKILGFTDEWYNMTPPNSTNQWNEMFKVHLSNKNTVKGNLLTINYQNEDKSDYKLKFQKFRDISLSGLSSCVKKHFQLSETTSTIKSMVRKLPFNIIVEQVAWIRSPANTDKWLRNRQLLRKQWGDHLYSGHLSQRDW